MIVALILVPLVAGGVAFLWPNDLGRRALLVAGRVCTRRWSWRPLGSCGPGPELGGRLAIDPTGLLFLSITTVLFLAAAVYCVGYLARERRAGHVDFVDHLYFSNEPEAVFTGCMLMFLASMTLVTLSQHFGWMWVGVEATTLASAPLIYFHRHHRSLEATWKYLLICSVGIALALLGNFLLAAAAADGVVERVDENGLIMTDQLAAKSSAGEDVIASRRQSTVQEEQPDAPTSMLLQDSAAHQRHPHQVAGSGLYVFPGGLRHQDGAGAAAHLAAGRPQRIPLGRIRATLRSPSELRFPGHPARPPDLCRCGRR